MKRQSSVAEAKVKTSRIEHEFSRPLPRFYKLHRNAASGESQHKPGSVLRVKVVADLFALYSQKLYIPLPSLAGCTGPDS